MSKLRKLKTKKLFYGKWPYKIATYCGGGSYIKIFGLAECAERANKGLFSGNNYRYHYIDNAKLYDFCKRYEKVVAEEHQVRAENSHVNFFVKDRAVYEKIIKIMGKFVINVTEPENDEVLNTLQSDKKFVVVDELPHGQYHYRIILKNMPIAQRENFVVLLNRYGADKIRMSKSTKRYLSGETHYMQDPFVYIGDEKMLAMLGLAASGYIKRTEQFVLKSSINTSLEQEQTCQPLVKA